MSISTHLDNLDFSRQMRALEPLLDRACAKISDTGHYVISVDGFEGEASFILVATRIAEAAEGRFKLGLGNPTLQERAAALKVVHRMETLYTEMTGEELPIEMERARDTVLTDFRTMPAAEYFRHFGNNTVGEGIFEDYVFADGYSIYFVDGDECHYIHAREAVILAEANLSYYRRPTTCAIEALCKKTYFQ